MSAEDPRGGEPEEDRSAPATPTGDDSGPTSEPAAEAGADTEPAAGGATGDGGSDDGSYAVQLDVFEGPLDLLLHLIRTQGLDVYDIPVFEVARQYDRYLERARELNLYIAGEYLVMAATLVHIKSRMLLPDPEPGTTDSAEDPRAELTHALLEFEKYKAAAEALRDREQVQSQMWGRPSQELPDSVEAWQLVDVSISDLVSTYQKIVAARLKEGAQIDIQRQTFSLADRIQWLLERVDESEPVPFGTLFEDAWTRAELVVTFVAVLELLRKQAIHAIQQHHLGPILISKV